MARVRLADREADEGGDEVRDLIKLQKANAKEVKRLEKLEGQEKKAVKKSVLNKYKAELKRTTTPATRQGAIPQLLKKYDLKPEDVTRKQKSVDEIANAIKETKANISSNKKGMGKIKLNLESKDISLSFD